MYIDDYHNTINGEIFIKWCENKLFPSFHRLFPSKQLILLLDNASYHHVRGPNYINPNQMKKDELAYKLVEFGYKEIYVDRKQNNNIIKKRFGQPSFYQRGGKWAPTVDELKKELKHYLKLHPELNLTEMQKLFKQHKYQLIYTPPYTPAVQPIEMVWSNVKSYVAKQYQLGRTMN